MFPRIIRSCERAAKRRTRVAKRRERGFSFSPLRGSLATLSCDGISRKTSGTRVKNAWLPLHLTITRIIPETKSRGLLEKKTSLYVLRSRKCNCVLRLFGYQSILNFRVMEMSDRMLRSSSLKNTYFSRDFGPF